ncbi:MAG: hypothetical protein ABR600_10650 [Actinomycetota bacterium]
MPETGPPEEDFQDAFARVEAALDAGNTDLSRLRFWRLVRAVKADAMLSAHWAETIGRIDRKAFELRVRPRFPVWFGNGLLLLGTAVGAAAIVYALGCDNRTVAGFLLLASGPILSVSIHDLAHWAWGRAVGMRFLWYFLDGPIRVQPGIKTDYASYLRTPPASRAGMHAAGAVASKIAPVIPLALWPLADAPAWAAWGLAAFVVVQVITDVTFSVKRSDWGKVRRELGVARAQEERKG